MGGEALPVDLGQLARRVVLTAVRVICQPGMPPVTVSPAGQEVLGRGGLAVGMFWGAVD